MEGGIRVPLIVYGPKVKKGTYSSIPVSSLDFLPTIMHLAGKKNKQSELIDGGSFKHLLFKNNQKTVKRKTEGLIFHVPYKNGIALNRPHSAVIKNGFKLITFYDNNEKALFKINSDISESNNLVNSHKKETKKLSEILDHYLTQVKAPKWQPGITWKNKSLKTINSFH
jgi:arylsulfatase A-like enzyme